MNAKLRNMRGEEGITFINDTAAKTGNWREIQCITACTFSVLTCSNNDGAAMTAIALTPTMPPLRGSFTAITLATGSVVALK